MEGDRVSNCAVFVNSFVQAAEVMDRIRRVAEQKMKALGFDFLYGKKQALNKIVRDSQEIRRLFDDAFLYGEHPIEEGLYDDGAGYDRFLETASTMTCLFLLIMDRCRTPEQERQVFELLESFPEVDLLQREIDQFKIR